jgi:hypothetical protein
MSLKLHLNDAFKNTRDITITGSSQRTKPRVSAGSATACLRRLACASGATKPTTSSGRRRPHRVHYIPSTRPPLPQGPRDPPTTSKHRRSIRALNMCARGHHLPQSITRPPHPASMVIYRQHAMYFHRPPCHNHYRPLWRSIAEPHPSPRFRPAPRPWKKGRKGSRWRWCRPRPCPMATAREEKGGDGVLTAKGTKSIPSHWGSPGLNPALFNAGWM